MASKLTPTQWALVAEQVLDGLTVRQAQAWIADNLGAQVSKSAVWANAEVRRAIGNRHRQRMQEAAEVLNESFIPMVRGITAIQKDLQTERDILRAAQLTHQPTSDEYLRISKQIRAIEASLKDSFRQYAMIIEKSGYVAPQYSETPEKDDGFERLMQKVNQKIASIEGLSPVSPAESTNPISEDS